MKAKNVKLTESNIKHFWIAKKFELIEEYILAGLSFKEIKIQLNNELEKGNQKPLAATTIRIHCRTVKEKIKNHA